MIETSVIPLSEHVEIIMRLSRMRKTAMPLANFAVIGRIRKSGECREVIRIDNHPHQNKAGTHAHFFDKGKKKDREPVEYMPDITTPWEAYQYIEAYFINRYPELL